MSSKYLVHTYITAIPGKNAQRTQKILPSRRDKLLIRVRATQKKIFLILTDSPREPILQLPTLSSSYLFTEWISCRRRWETRSARNRSITHSLKRWGSTKSSMEQPLFLLYILNIILHPSVVRPILSSNTYIFQKHIWRNPRSHSWSAIFFNIMCPLSSESKLNAAHWV